MWNSRRPIRAALAVSALSLSWHLLAGTATVGMGGFAALGWLAWVLAERGPNPRKDVP